MGRTSSSFRVLSETILFSSFLCNRRLAIASEIAMAPIESRPDQSDCDAYPHLEAVAISKRIELEGWGWAEPLHLFEFFQKLSYSVHFYATGDSQLHLKSR
jgi:hypothetical protein